MFKLCMILLSFVFTLSAEEPLCHVFLVQVPDQPLDEGLTNVEMPFALRLAESLSHMPLTAVYSSDEPCAKQTAELIAAYHNLPIITHMTLQAILPNTLFLRMGELRTLGLSLVERHLGEQIVIVTHESLVRFVGRYVHGKFQQIPHFSFIQVSSDGKSMFLSFLKSLLFSE